MLFRGERAIPKDLRVNERIRAKEVRLIDENGQQLGVVSLSEALQIARERNTDLVEVAPTAVPPVCRLLDYGKFKYEQTKREREARRHQKVVLLKEIRLRPKIDEHDIGFKMRMAQRFLQEGSKVKFTVIFRGREVTHPQLGRQVLEKVTSQLRDVATVEKPLAMEGRNLTLILAPLGKSAREGGVKESSKPGASSEGSQHGTASEGVP